MEAKKLIDEAKSLPVEERVEVADSLLKSLNRIDPEVDAKWAEVAEKRLDEVRSGEVKLEEGKEVFDRIKAKFSP